MAMKLALIMGFCGLLASCGAKAPSGTGGFQTNATNDACPAAYVVSGSDYTSTNISALSPTGSLLSASVISSGSAPPGLTTALSGDVIFPTSAPSSGKLVLIDRYPNSVLTWVEPATGEVIQQLPVGTGFAANPHDYLELAKDKAYVSRYESNPSPGEQPFDEGGDLLIVDPEAKQITGRIAMPVDDGAFLPRVDRLLRVGATVWVGLHRFDADFKTAGDARLVGVDPTLDAVTWTVDLPGVASCGGLARSPSGDRVALACSGVAGDLDPAGHPDPTRRSDIVLLDATVEPPVLLQRFAVATSLGATIGSALAFASEHSLLGVVFGDSATQRNDSAFTLDTTVGTPKALLDAGAAFALGDVRCAPGCTDLCFLADAQSNELHVWKVAGDALLAQQAIPGDTSIGLPPRAIGAL